MVAHGTCFVNTVGSCVTFVVQKKFKKIFTGFVLLVTHSILKKFSRVL